MNLRIVEFIARKYSVITFDIFDTLIERTTKTPSQIFVMSGSKILGDRQGKIFKNDRIEAEINARKKALNGEVTLSDIYNELSSKYESNLNELINAEIEMEKSSCRPKNKNVKLLKIFKRQGKKIYLVSDMYLPRKIIECMLEQCGVSRYDYDQLYISNIYKKNKRNGDLFKVVISENNLNPKEILHFGDSLKADFIGGHKAGIKTFIVKKKNRIKRILSR